MGYYRYYSCDVPDLADQQLGLRDTDRVSEVRDQKQTETETRRSRVSPLSFVIVSTVVLYAMNFLPLKKCQPDVPDFAAQSISRTSPAMGVAPVRRILSPT